ncbi:MAG: RNA polymerase sigma factor FliA [Pseudomonadota bacterium]
MSSAAVKIAAYQEENHDQLIERHAPLVKRVAYHLLGRLPDSVQADDLIQSGMIGLLEAARNYENSHGASFETYAGIRIRGAMLDEVRRNDWVPRSVHRRSRELAEAIRRLEARLGRTAQDIEIASEMAIGLEEYYHMLQDVSGTRIFSFDEIGHEDESALEMMPSGEPGVTETLQQQERSAELSEAIERLPERERLVMSLYYGDDLNLKEVGEVIGVTESRVCQIHSQALARLRARLVSEAAQGAV